MKGESGSWSNVTCSFFPAIYFITVWGWQDTKIINCLWFVTSISRFAATWRSIGWEMQWEVSRKAKDFSGFVSFYEFLKNWLRLFDRIRTLQLDQQGDRGNILCQNWEPPGRNRGLCRSGMVIIILLHQACQDSIVNFTHFQAAYGQVDRMHMYI